MRNKLSVLFLFTILLTGFVGAIPTADAAVSATGGTITYSGNYIIHTFTTSGTFTVTNGGNVDYLIVGGGGSGGSGGGGAGGAGGFRTDTAHAVTVQAYTVTVGAGGAAPGVNSQGNDGSASSFDGISAAGGGGGGHYNGGAPTAGNNGGSGAGGGSGGGSGPAGSGNTPSVSPSQGEDGEAGDVANNYGGGGGGAGEVGGTDGGGDGGDGTSSSISGTPTTYAGGGGGAGSGVGLGGIGGDGGGGDGGEAAGAPTAGTPNTGGGGGGGWQVGVATGAAGGSGIVIISYLNGDPPDAVDDLVSPSQSFGTVDLSWTEPGLNGGNVTGYWIKYATPYGEPDTTINNDTGTSDTTLSVTGLGLGVPYTFGVGVWTEVGTNSTHPPMTWLNVTTEGNFTIGTATFNQTNTQVLPISFEEQSINSTAKFLNVTFSNTFDMSCDFNYKFANTNQTYDSLTSYAVSTTLNETAFIFNDYENEIIDVFCWDKTTLTDGRYILTQSDFPLLQQIEDFRSGENGTQGMFGVFDVISLIVIIVAMIGLNRLNESVGAIFFVAIVGSAAFFGIIEIPVAILGLLSLVVLLIITTTRKP